MSFTPYTRSISPNNKMPSLPDFGKYDSSTGKKNRHDELIINKILLNPHLAKSKDTNNSDNSDNLKVFITR